MVSRWRIFGNFLHPVFSASHMQHISDLHPKFALRPHHVWKYGRHPICNSCEQARKQEGQHPLTGQHAVNFRLLANQWAECRLVTQWRHNSALWGEVCATEVLPMRVSPFAFRYQGNGATPANILIPLERQLIVLQLYRWQFLYNETLQETFHPLFSKLSRRRQI